jgi:hypothetical protein
MLLTHIMHVASLSDHHMAMTGAHSLCHCVVHLVVVSALGEQVLPTLMMRLYAVLSAA